MNSGISPTSALGGRALLAATPNIPGNPRLALLAGRPSARGEPAVFPPLLPPPSPPFPGPWDGRSRERVVWRGTRFAGQMQKGVLVGEV